MSSQISLDDSLIQAAMATFADLPVELKLDILDLILDHEECLALSHITNRAVRQLSLINRDWRAFLVPFVWR